MRLLYGFGSMLIPYKLIHLASNLGLTPPNLRRLSNVTPSNLKRVRDDTYERYGLKGLAFVLVAITICVYAESAVIILGVNNDAIKALLLLTAIASNTLLAFIACFCFLKPLRALRAFGVATAVFALTFGVVCGVVRLF